MNSILKRCRLSASLAILLAFACSFSPFSARQWKLSPGDIREAPSDEDWFFRGESLFMSRTTVPGGEVYGHTASQTDVVRIVLGGSLENTYGNDTIFQETGDCLFLADCATHGIRAPGDSTVYMDIHFTAGNGNGTSSLSHGEVINRNRLQFCQPERGIDARIIETRAGQIAFVRMERDTYFPERSSGVEQLLYITRGKMTVTVDGAKSRMTEGDILALGKDSRVSFDTGPRGCDVIAAFAPGRRDYSKALTDRMTVFHTIIAPGKEPTLLVDGENSEPGLTFTEGPSWMNGRLYFSNYYKFWKPFGSSDEGGIWIVEEDGTYRVLNKNVQTCGTTPLPNGTLGVCDLFGCSVVEMDPETGEMGRTVVGSYGGIPFAVANDVITDRKGGLYVTDSSVAKEGPKQPGTALYYHNSRGETIRVTEPNDVEYINGVMLTEEDKILFLNGSGEIYVWAFDVNPDGTLSNKRPFAKLLAPDDQLGKENPRSVADGMTIDREGNIYVATPLGIQVFDRTGSFAGIIHFGKGPSHCTFGGSDLKTLYVTARTHVYSIRTLKTGFQYPIGH